MSDLIERLEAALREEADILWKSSRSESDDLMAKTFDRLAGVIAALKAHKESNP